MGLCCVPPITIGNVRAQILQATSPGPRTRFVLSPGFVLYFPFTVANPTVVTWPTLVSVLNEVYPGNTVPTTLPALRIYGNVAAPLVGITSLDDPVESLGTSDTLYIPVTVSLATSLDMNPGVARLRDAASPTVPGAPTSSISSTRTSISATLTTGATTLTSSPAILQTVTPVPEDDDTPSTATLAGGIVGGILAAILLCGLLGFFFIRRRRSKRSTRASEEPEKKAPDTMSGMAGPQRQEMDNTNPLVVEVKDSSAIPISDLWLAPEDGRTSWWDLRRKGAQ